MSNRSSNSRHTAAPDSRVTTVGDQRETLGAGGHVSAGGNRLMWWVIAAFAVQFAVWAAWLTFAAQHPIAEVPLVTGR